MYYSLVLFSIIIMAMYYSLDLKRFQLFLASIETGSTVARNKNCSLHYAAHVTSQKFHFCTQTRSTRRIIALL